MTWVVIAPEDVPWGRANKNFLVAHAPVTYNRINFLRIDSPVGNSVLDHGSNALGVASTIVLESLSRVDIKALARCMVVRISIRPVHSSWTHSVASQGR